MRRTLPLGAALLALCAAIYAPALRHGFIADDFVNLDFVRRYRGSWAAFLSPLAAYSDPVTRSRYKPLYVYYFRALDGLFGDTSWAWHALSLIWHVAAALCVFALARMLFDDRRLGAVAATLFATSRLQGQMVIWVSANYRLLSAAMTLGALLALDLRRTVPSVALCAGLFTLSIATNPEAVVLLPVLGVFALLRGGDPPARSRALQCLAACLPVGVGFALANRLSQTRFTDLPIGHVPDPGRVAMFFGNLALPFEAPLRVKVGVALGLAAGMLALRDRRVVAMLGCALACALFYALLEYPLAPRYLYLASAFWCVGLARGLCVLALRVHPRAVWAAAAPWVLLSAAAIRDPDIEDFAYLARVGERLGAVQREARARGRAISVRITPVSSLDARNLAFLAVDGVARQCAEL
jgi:hypothetical protein